MKVEWDLVDVARKDLIALLESLSEAQWNAQSLCSEWRVRNVVAHLTSMTRVGAGAMLWGVITNGFRPSRFMGREARAYGDATPIRKLLDELEATVGLHTAPPGLTPKILVYDMTVHALDIAVPLGLPYPVRPDLFAVAAAVAKLGRGLTLRTTDLAWSSGSGPEVHGLSPSLLLALANRPVGLTGLSGPGLPILASRLS